MDADYRGLARILGMQGRYGDTLVAHISPSEAAMLQRMGGSGTRNPCTGLLEFYGSEGGAGAQGKSTGGQGSAHADAGVGGRSGNGLNDHGFRSTGAGPGASANTHTSFGGQVGGNANGSNNGVIGDAFGRLARGIGLSGQPADVSASKFGNENAYNGVTNQTADPGFDTGLTERDWGRIGALVAGFALGPEVGAIAGAASQGLDDTDTVKIGGQTVTEKRDTFKDGRAANQGHIDRGNGGRGDVADNPMNHASIAKNAQQANAGGGLIGALDPSNAGNTVPPAQMPTGLLQYLAQNPPYLPGYSSTTGFGASVMPQFNFYRPIA